MKNKIKTFLRHNYIYIIMVILVIVRITVGHMLGAWYMVDYAYDDLAMFDGLSPQRIINPSHMSLIKNLAFSVFLGITGLSGIPYTIMTGILWSLTALVVWLLLKKVTSKRWVQLLGFVYVLFLPIAFESWGGLRIYRNAIIAPCIILTMTLLTMIVVDVVKWKDIKKSTIITSIMAGVAFCYTYFLKEDGIWLMLTAGAMMTFCIVVTIVHFFKDRQKKNAKLTTRKSIKWAIICIVPFLVLFTGDTIYRGFNNMAFGVREINTRTEGELGKFVYNIYKIESPNRSMTIWAPYDAIQKAFKVSPTLGAHPELLEGIMTTEWFDGDIVNNPIPKDFLTWVIRTELTQAGLWTSEKDVNDLFRQVNSEIQAAFNSGALEKTTGRIQIISSIAGYTPEEIAESNFLSQLWWAFEDAVWLKGYAPGYDYDIKGDSTKIERVTNMNTSEINSPSGSRKAVAKAICSIIFAIYRVANTVLIIATVIFITTQAIALAKKHKLKTISHKNIQVQSLSLGLGLFFLGITFAYTIATAWFFIQPATVEFYGTGRSDFIFYNVGVPALITMVYISVIPGISSSISKK